MKKYDVKLSDMFFYMAYVLYFLSFFVFDVLLRESYGDTIVKLIRYVSYFLFIIDILLLKEIKFNIKGLLVVFLLMCYSVIFLFTKDTYFLSLFVIVYASLKINPKKILKVSFYLLLFLTIIVLLLTVLGVLENRNLIKKTGESRFTFGFYHSNVLPMIIFYLFGYRLILKKKLSKKEIAVWLALSLSAYYFCYSRSGIIGSVVIFVLYAVYQNREIIEKNILSKIMFKYSILLLNIFNTAMIILSPYHISIVYRINQMFTGRFALAYLKSKDIGLHLVSLSSGGTFSSSEYTIDSGYSYVLLKYGLLFILFYVFLQFCIYKKYKNDKMMIIVFFAVTLTNFIDNDLFSYGFLPFIIFAFSTYYNSSGENLIYMLKSKFKNKSKRKRRIKFGL